jgi:SHS2 domain-containing protein
MIEVVDHTGELEFRISHPSLAGLYAEAVRGLVLEVEGAAPPRGDERRDVDLDSSGRETLLADLLNEVVFLMETEGFLPSALEVDEVRDGHLRGALVGRSDREIRPLVKAATYHDLRVWHEGGTWHGRVIIDV